MSDNVAHTSGLSECTVPLDLILFSRPFSGSDYDFLVLGIIFWFSSSGLKTYVRTFSHKAVPAHRKRPVMPCEFPYKLRDL